VLLEEKTHKEDLIVGLQSLIVELQAEVERLLTALAIIGNGNLIMKENDIRDFARETISPTDAKTHKGDLIVELQSLIVQLQAEVEHLGTALAIIGNGKLIMKENDIRDFARETISLTDAPRREILRGATKR
jgi:uncharacterized coiled-coil protein SlyX